MGTILLTGGTSFIGSHTSVELLGAGENVILADNLSNSSEQVINRIQQITGQKPKFYCVDVTDRTGLNRIFEENSIDAVIHFAGLKAVGESVRKPIRYYRNNLDSTLTLLEVMREQNVKRLIFSSSATVYGKSCSAPFTERTPTGGCTNPNHRRSEDRDNALASKVFWSQKTAGGDSDESPPFA